MALIIVKTKTFTSQILQPLPTPDGSSLEEIVNVFTASISSTNVLDIIFETKAVGKYGTATLHYAYVVYKQ